MDKAQALTTFGLTAGKPVLLVMGGSQGAHGINQSLINALPQLQGHALQVIHLTGKQDEQLMRESYAKAGIPAFVAAFHHRMEEAYSAADFAISRSGAASLTELSHFALPSILIPYPFAAEDHQTFNANIFERAGAATLLKERETSGETLAQKLLWFLDDPTRLSEMSARSASLAPQQAAERVADTILNSCA
jgi:UDP-N-acetylglucosamine--N-acetylmuramyl-(pentapeptide) pyrophosphoryl-undecaprenol N-acetylglucosamine transferase